jgi:hypothetical protein
MVCQKVLVPVRLAYALLGVVVVEMAARQQTVSHQRLVYQTRRHVPGRDRPVEWCQDCP